MENLKQPCNILCRPSAVAKHTLTNMTCSWTSPPDRKSTRLNSSHVRISYAVSCLNKKERLYVMLGFQHHGDHFVPAKTQEHGELVPGPGFDLRSFLVLSVVTRIVVVIFYHAEHVV